jgi:hypothetical protein
MAGLGLGLGYGRVRGLHLGKGGVAQQWVQHWARARKRVCMFLPMKTNFPFAVSMYLETLSTVVEGVSSDPMKDHETVRETSLHHQFHP